MMSYENKTGKSGISSYEVSDDKSEITVVFHGGKSYSYPCNEEIAAIAESGAGLNTFINANLK